MKTARAIENCACPACSRRPATTDPLPRGWYWDTAEPDNPWAWCPTCDPIPTPKDGDFQEVFDFGSGSLRTGYPCWSYSPALA